MINKTSKGGQVNKDFIINKIKLLYNPTSDAAPQEDKKWDQLMASFDRLRKAVTHQKETLTELDNKALVLLKRRQEREAAGAEYLKKLQMYKDKLEIEKLQQELIKRKKKKKANDDPEGRKEQNTAFLSVD